MRVAVNIRNANLGIPDGHGESMRALVREMSSIPGGHQVDYLCDAPLHFEGSANLAAGTRVLRPFPIGNRALRRVFEADPWYRLRVAIQAVRRGWNVYVQSAHEPPPAFGIGAQVVIVHDLAFIHPDAPENFDEALIVELDRWTAVNVHAATIVVAVSDVVARDVARSYGVPSTKILTAHHGVDSNRFHPNHDAVDIAACRRRYDLEPDYAIFVGTIQPRKNIPTLVEAVRRAHAQGVATRLIVVGASGWRSESSIEAVQQVGPTVARCIGQVGADDLPLLLAGANAFISVARDEGFGMPALEAMASGIPVIAADDAGLAEVVGEAGLLVNPEDPDAISSAIARLSGDQQLRSDMIGRGLRRAEAFTWKAAAHNVWGAIERACASS
jgi:glycosyltransferase involved in cell wall biosynthesis